MSARNSKRSSHNVAVRRLRAIKDEDIDYSDIPPLSDQFFQTAELLMPTPKKPVSLRLDADVVAWFQKSGAGYQSRMNAVLKAFMAAQREPRK
jgi:uncharacterized protein (DUF4415 family)